MAGSEPRGAYVADRAAALSGVPKSTVHYWAREGVLVPSVSAERVKLWSYTDLLGLRTIYWLRQTKTASDGREVPRTAMPAVRKALNALLEYELALWTEEGSPRIAVDRGGQVFLRTDEVATPEGVRPLAPEWLDLIEPFTTSERTMGPDLLSPRPNLRIVPGKLAGSPHVASTRVETIAIAAVAQRGVGEVAIRALYPNLAPVAIAEALDLEQQLRHNLQAAA
jgi:uncharacterized protein (DUF433 family)